MKLFKKEISRQKLLYGGLITTFAILYGATAFVSWYHAITFFNIANAVWLSVILSFVAEIGQASALFSLLLTDNTKKFLTWFVMIVLTALQVIGNVVSSYDWIIQHNGAGVEAFQKSILFWMQAADPEIFKVVIAWISGALLPIIALSMTALVAQNMDLRVHKAKTKLDDEDTNEAVTPQPVVDPKDFISEVVKIHPTEEQLKELENFLNSKKPIEKVPVEEEVEINPNDILGRTDEEIMLNKLKNSEEAKRIREIMEKSDEISIPKIKPSDEIESTPLVGIDGAFEEKEKPFDIKEFLDGQPTEKVVFTSPGVFTVEKEEHTEPSVEQILANLSPEAKEYMKKALDEEIPIDEDDEDKSYLDEEVERLTPEAENTQEWRVTDGKLTPEHEKFVEEQSEINEAQALPPEEPEVAITQQNGLVGFEPMEKPNEPISEDIITAEEAKLKEENERLERLRAIARENLKKK